MRTQLYAGRLVEQLAADPGFTFSYNCCKAVWRGNLLPFQLCSRDRQLQNTLQHEQRPQACPLPLGVVSLVSGEGKTVVHLIREDSCSRYMPSGVDRPRSLSGSNARSLHFGIESV